MPVIDLHAHMTPACLIQALRTGDLVHGIDPAAIARGMLRSISADDRLADMDRCGIDAQVVSCEPQMYCYQFAAADALAVHRDCNDEVAALVRDHPNRFAGLAILPMQDMASAIGEMTRALGELGLRGVMIGDHVNGHLLDEHMFRAFWRAAESMNAVVFLHQASPTLVSVRTSRYHLGNTIGNAMDRTVSAASIVCGGVLEDFPGLRICLAHGGGYLCFAAGRLDWGYKWRPSAREHISRPPSTYLRQFYYDCITHDEQALRFLIETVGVDRVVFGSDYPGFAAGPEGIGYDPMAWFMSLPNLSDAEKAAITSGNPATLLGLK
jgi:aminocarboxymuconate-semialdehyde decarboxylase